MRDFARRLLFLPEAASQLADDIDHLHFFVISVTMVGSLIVGALALWFALVYRRSRRSLVTPRVVAPIALEAPLIAGLLGLFIVWWVIGFKQYIRAQADAPDGQDALEIYVTAKQWMWKFSYPDGTRSIDLLVVPRGKPVRLLLTSRDVIHSFFVPELRQKQDVLPERYTKFTFTAAHPGTFPILCAEYCGGGHSQMRGDIVVLEPDAYQRWATEQAGDIARPDARDLSDVHNLSPLAAEGKRLAERYACLTCHSVTGAPLVGPPWYGLYGSDRPLVDGTHVAADENYLTESILYPELKRARGYDQVMPTFRGVLSPSDVSALIAYIKALGAREPREPDRREPERPVAAPSDGKQPDATPAASPEAR